MTLFKLGDAVFMLVRLETPVLADSGLSRDPTAVLPVCDEPLLIR
jgi:hypothetical protein